ncbi:MAG TPA: sigma-70 family RNA polymerase sigma factor [Conexibacter sp.]|jgi:RNA polymerase sigma factor (sigma-70 family)|nr:sigma-70 family RNA polymerase sigma factor [Conexibacter sp.]
MRSSERGAESAEQAALRLVQEHAVDLLRFARRFSHCADDAHDAYQRAVEILVRRMRTEPPAHPLSWTRTVLRHEALALRTEREQLVGRTEVDLDRHEARHLEDPAERVLGHERVRQTAEALRRLKPQEVTALVLRAEGLSYREICTRTGWTYTRTNRTVTEGRRALLQRLGAIESGAECERWLPLLSALADGEATVAELAELRPHLRSCPACRATLRDFHAAPAHLAALVPPSLVPLATTSGGGSLLRHVGVALDGLAERATLLTARVQGTFEALSGTKLAAVAASTAALAGGGVAIEHATEARPAPHVAAASSAGASAAPGTARLMTISLPFRPSGAGTPARRTGPAGPGSEFAAARSSASEFASHPAPAASEFASSGAASQAPATASAAAPSPPVAADLHGQSPEFAGP